MNKQLSLFDIVLEQPATPPIADAAADPKTQPEKALITPTTPLMEEGQKKVVTPYKIPTVEEIMKDLDQAAHKVNRSQLIEDIFECGALAISNSVDKVHFAEREERYLSIIKKYNKPEQETLTKIFSKIFALLTSVTYDNGNFSDYLGEIFMRSNMANGRRGQVFTPYHIANFMAKITMDEQLKDYKGDEILTINDPCCGSGAMSMGALDVLKNDLNINYTHNCYFECSDIDIRCVHMAYLQLSLAGATAIVKHQNTLTNETWSVWKTPAFIFQYMRFRKYYRN